jgi:hypothetical protein
VGLRPGASVPGGGEAALIGWFLLVNALWLLAGFGVTSAAGWRSGPGVAYLAGVAAYGVVAQFLFVLGLAMTRVEVIVVCALLALGLVRRTGIHVPRPTIVAVPVAIVLAVLAVDLWFQPLWAYDSWTFWTPKAYALSTIGLDAHWFAQPALFNRDYPLLLPAVEAAGFRYTGYETRLLDVQSLVFVIALLLAFTEVVGPRGPRWRFVIPLLVVLAPSLADQLAAAEADIPLAAFFASAAGLAYLWHRERAPGSLALVGVLSAGVVATKAEGLSFVVALAASLMIVESRRGAATIAGVAVGAVVAGLVPWRLWVDAHDIPEQQALGRVSDLTGRATRATLAVRYLAERLFDPRAWLLLVPLLVVVTVLAYVHGRRRDVVLAGTLVLLCLAAMVFAYWTSQFEIHYHLATSARRVIDAPIHAWAFLVPLLFAPNGAFTGPRYPQDP